MKYYTFIFKTPFSYSPVETMVNIEAVDCSHAYAIFVNKGYTEELVIMCIESSTPMTIVL